MAINVLGPLLVEGHGLASLAPRDRVVLGVLVVRLGREVPRDTLADALWPDDPPASAGKVVQGCIVRLRRVLGTDAIETGSAGYRLMVPAHEVDARRFEDLLRRGAEQLAVGEPDRAAHTALEALDLWRGPALPELEEWEPGRVEGERLADLHLQAQDLLLEARIASGMHHDVLSEARVRAAEEPLRERRWHLLARAQYQAGLQADALATLRRAREHLLDELGLDPDPSLVQLEEAILRQDPDLAVSAAPQASGEPPYPGLRPFDVDDAASFFGRDREVEECLTLWAAHGVLAVVGASGSGKSSLVRAGVAATLEERGHRVVVITPGSHPLDALREAVGSRTSPEETVLVVDQAEELVTLCDSEDERLGFVSALVELAPRARPVIALSADRLGEVAAYPTLLRLIEPGLYLLTRLEHDALRQVIEGPARLAGLLLEPGLVNLLVQDVEEQPGALPMLSHALRQTWERREGRTMTVAGYEASGGIGGAVAQSAEHIYHDLTPDQQVAARDLLLRLVTPSQDREPVLNRVANDVVAPDHARERIVDRLVRARLLTRDRGALEIAHASLVRAWPRLRGWLAEDLQGQLLWHHLTDASLAWDAAGRPEDELYRGARLAAATEWEGTTLPSLTGVEREFLAASRSVHEREARRAGEEAARQRRSVRRLRFLVAAVAVVALVATLLGTSAVQQAERADAEAVRARSHELAASSLQVLQDDPGLARSLATVAAVTGPPSLQTSGALHRALAEDRVVARLAFPHHVGRLTSDIHPDGDRVAMTGEFPDAGSRAVEVQWAETGNHDTIRLPEEAEATSALFDRVHYSPDGDHLLAGVIWSPGYPGRIGPQVAQDQEAPTDLVGVHVYDAQTHDLLDVVDVGPCGGGLLDATRTHLTVYVPPGPGCNWGSPRTLVLVDRDTGERTVLSEGVTNLIGTAVLSEGGDVVVHEYRVPGEPGATDVREVVVHDLRTDTEVARWEGDTLRAVSPDGRFVLQGIGEWTVTDLHNLDVDPRRFGGETGVGVYADFGGDGLSLTTVSLDGEVSRWDHRTGERLTRHPGLRSGALSVARDGTVAVADSSGYVVAVLDLDEGAEGPKVQICALDSAGLTSVWRSGTELLVSGPCQEGGYRTAMVQVDEAQARVLTEHETHGRAMSPDGRRWFRSVEQGRGEAEVLQVVARGTGDDETVVLQGVCDRAVEGGGDPEEAGCAALPEQPFFFAPCDASWSPDGALLAATACPFHPGLAVWDTRTGELRHASARPDEETGGVPVDALFTPDGSELVVTTDSGRVVVLAVDDWRVVRHGTPQVLGSWWTRVVGFTRDGDLIAVTQMQTPDASGEAALHRLDGETLEQEATRLTLHEGAVLDAALQPETGRVATASAQGLVRVWDSATLDLVHEVPVGHAVLTVTWLDEERLAVLAQDGSLSVVTTDPQLLLATRRSSVSRPLTTSECRRFGFADADCPTLGTLAGWAEPPAELDGTYRLNRDATGLAADMRVGFETLHGAPPDDASQEELGLIANDILRDGTGLHLSLAAGVFRIEPHGVEPAQVEDPEPFCVGSYRVVDGRLVLTAERGSWCLPGLYLDAAYDLTDEGLTLHSREFRGPFWERYLWGDQVLVRAG